MSFYPTLKKSLRDLGYRDELFSENVVGWQSGTTIPLVAHSRLPRDIRTAAIAVLPADKDRSRQNATVKETGSAVALEFTQSEWSLSRVSNDRIVQFGKGRLSGLDAYFRKHQDQLHPDAIYRAKTWGRLDPTVRQLEFVDSGLIPLVENQLGQKVSQLLEECVQDLAATLGWKEFSEHPASRRNAQWLVKAPFWLLAAKALHDKRVPNFKRLDLQDFDSVFGRLARHYNSQDSAPIAVPKSREKALQKVAERIQNFASLDLLSAEALGHVYESSVINKATRKLLGTHSTPPWLIDYIVGKLRPWIAEIPVEERVVFEPACGHAGFLVAALRLLDELRPANHSEDRIPYLRNRLYGVDIDPFSQEVARLALTLADVPNPNGWKLSQGDMFTSDIIEKTCGKANIVLANPPFESFGKSKQAGWLDNKASETLSRIVHSLPEGGVLGFVGPQGFLQNRQAEDLRRCLLSDYEISEVTLFADKVFQYGAPESAVILARRLTKAQRPNTKAIRFSRVREQEIQDFSESQKANSVETVHAHELLQKDFAPIFAPMLQEVWSHLKGPKFQGLGEIAELGKGFEHKGATDPSLSANAVRESQEEFEGGVVGFAGWRRSQFLHQLPVGTFLNLSREVVKTPRYGLLQEVPQVLLNYARVSRGPWRLKALIDQKGHPVTSDFVVCRPTKGSFPLEFFWAVVNSAIGNAFMFCSLGKRHNLVGKIRELPVPRVDQADIAPLVRSVRSYLSAADKWKPENADELTLFSQKSPGNGSGPSPDELRALMLRVDAEVMKLYALPPELERKLLDIFCGQERKGVPFHQEGYFPEGFVGLNTVGELLIVTRDWDSYAERKTDLIEKKVNKEANRKELAELKELKRLSAARRDLLAPLPLAELRELHRKLTS